MVVQLDKRQIQALLLILQFFPQTVAMGVNGQRSQIVADPFHNVVQPVEGYVSCSLENSSRSSGDEVYQTSFSQQMSRL